MARFAGSGGFRLLLHGERVCFGGEPKESARFRVSGGKNIKNTIEVRSSGKSVGHRGGGRIFSAGKKIGSSKAGERLKREHYYDTDDVDDDDEDDDNDDDDDDNEEDVHDDGLACFRGLVLDISYRPVNVVCWKRAICLEFMEKADVLEYYDQTVTSPRGSFYIPAVLRVTACGICNSKKGHKTIEEANMKLIKVPKAPKDFDILAIPLTSAAVRMLKMRKGVPEEWLQYLSS